MDIRVFILLFAYFIIISAIGIFMTVKDKSASKFRGKRVPETNLMIVGFLGAAFPMFLTMNIIHHKTKHPKFMIGLPVAVALHIILIVAVYFILTQTPEMPVTTA